eukprot:gene5531-6890_t
MKYSLFVILLLVIVGVCNGLKYRETVDKESSGSSSNYLMVGMEPGLSSTTIRTFGPASANNNPFPGKVVAKLNGATTLLIDGLSYSVSAVRGTSYYVLLQYDVDIFLYGIDLNSGDLFINRFSENQAEMYVYALAYDATYDNLIGLSSIRFQDQSWFDVVLLNPETGAFSKNLTFGEFPNGALYSGIYAFDQDNSRLFVGFKQYTNATESTQEGLVVIDTQHGTILDTFWLSGWGAQDVWLHSLVYDTQTSMLYGASSTYVGTNNAFVNINPATGFISLITNTTTVYGGLGPVIIPDSGLFVCPGKESISSRSIYYVNLSNGKEVNEHSNVMVNVQFLSLYQSS